MPAENPLVLPVNEKAIEKPLSVKSIVKYFDKPVGGKSSFEEDMAALTEEEKKQLRAGFQALLDVLNETSRERET